MDSYATQPHISGFANYLETKHYLDKKNIHSYLEDAAKKNLPFILYLTQHNLINPTYLAQITAQYFNMPLFDLDSYNLDHLPQNILKIEWVQKHFILPLFYVQNTLFFAIIDPTVISLTELNFLTGSTGILIIVEADKLVKVIHTLYSSHLQTIEYTKNSTKEDLHKENVNDSNVKLKSQDAPLNQFLHTILLDAINKNASDIHIEPYDNLYRIRYRIDGILHEAHQQPSNIASTMIARLKILANLDIAERRIPQDGRFKISSPYTCPLDFRISTCPTLQGEKVALRIISQSTDFLNFDTLGMTKLQKDLICEILSNPQGIVLVTGPTGSGKTSTLYSALQYLNTTDINICSVEDPIEIQIPGINQVQINLKTGLTFATTLRAFLRQDPDIIMIGEIRDLETANIAVNAAQTGHLVLATLHANSTIQTLQRLNNLGISSFNIAGSIILIIAQRLARCLCKYCKEPHSIPRKTLISQGFTLTDMDTLNIYKAKGCIHCHQGYKGRIGIYEMMPISKKMRQLITENSSNLMLSQQADIEGIADLRQIALNYVHQGITSLDEINRIIKN